MPNNMSELVKRTLMGYYYPALEELEKTPYALGYETGYSICLLEMKMCIIKYKRYACRNDMIKLDLEFFESLFGIKGTYFGNFLKLSVVVNVEVIGFYYSPVETFILNFVPAEEIELGLCNGRNDE